MMKRFLTLLLALGLLGAAVPAANAEDTTTGLPAWAYGEIADIYAIGLAGDEITTEHASTVTQEQLEAMTQLTADKLALLNRPANPEKGDSLIIDTTRGGVLHPMILELCFMID